MGHDITSTALADTPRAEVRFRLPQAALSGLITTYYFVEIIGASDSEVEDLLHPEWGNLRLRMGHNWDIADGDGQFAASPPAALFGPTSRARAVVARPGMVIGAVFTPQGWESLVRINAAKLADSVIPAGEILPDVVSLHADLISAIDEDRRVAILDDYFGRRLNIRHQPDRRIDAILIALNDAEDHTVEELAGLVDMTTTQLTRACQRWFGFSAKILLRRQRFLRTLASLMEPGDRPTREILDHSYFDQSHFNREFRRFMGMAPREYFGRPRSILRPATVNRTREVGAALQGLHRVSRLRAAR